MDKDWDIGVVYQAMSMKLDVVDPGKEVKTIALDTMATKTNVTWAFDGISTEDPQLGYESYWDPMTMKLDLPTKGSTTIGMPPKVVPTVAMSFGQQDGTPWALKCWACLRIPFQPGPSAPEQYIAVLSSGSDLKVVLKSIDLSIKNLVFYADQKVTWDFTDLKPTSVKFTFAGPGTSDTGPFDSITETSTGSHVWVTSMNDTQKYGHYKYTLVLQGTPKGDITIDPTIDYLPPPATYPIHGPQRRGAGLRRHQS